MFNLEYKTKFKKDLKLLKKRSEKDFNLLKQFIKYLQINGYNGIPDKNKPHLLKGNYKGFCEAHIKPDLLLIWEEKIDTNIIILIRTGTHSDLFDK